MAVEQLKEDILGIFGKGLRKKTNRNIFGKIYRLSPARFERILTMIFAPKGMTDSQAKAITADYARALKDRIEIPFMQDLKRKDPRLFMTLKRRKAAVRGRSPGFLVYIVPTYRALQEGTGLAGWKGRRLEFADFLTNRFRQATEPELDTLGGVGNKAGTNIGHAEGQEGLAVSSVGVLQAEAKIAAARAKGLAVDSFQSAVDDYKAQIGLEMTHDQVISADGKFNKGYTAVLTDQATADNQGSEEYVREVTSTRQFKKRIRDAVTDDNSTPLGEALTQALMYNLTKGKKVRGTGKKAQTVKDSTKAKGTKNVKTPPTDYEIFTEGGPDVDSLLALTPRRTQNKDQFSMARIMGVLNEKLPQTVRKNMGAPRLENQTGRFANSVKVTDITKTARGFPSVGYTYEKDPYQVFEMTQGRPPWATTDRDPRGLIDASIREVAANLALGRFYTRRQ